MTRLYGRAHGGQRCKDACPHGHWETTTMLSSVKLDGSTECVVFDGAVDKSIFCEYIDKILSPSLQKGDVVIMDNLSSHKNNKVLEIIEGKGARVLFLPPYSPDFNPIEKMWSKIKQILRSLKARSQEELISAIAQALDSVTTSDAKGWFESCGYSISQA
jgi:transposase